MLSKTWLWTLYSSSDCHNLSLFTLLNAFSWSTNMMFSSLSCSVAFSLSCLQAKIESGKPLPFLKAICASRTNGSALYLARCSRTFAYSLPTWISGEMPLNIPQSLLLPFFFYVGIFHSMLFRRWMLARGCLILHVQGWPYLQYHLSLDSCS